MAKAESNIDEFLGEVELALERARDTPEIGALIEPYGYTAGRLGEGRALFDRARALWQRERRESAEASQAAEAQETAWAQAMAVYNAQLKIAREIFDQNAEARAELGLAGTRHRSLSGWLSQARQFYTSALASATVAGELAVYGVPREALIGGQQLLEALASASDDYDREHGEAKGATTARDRALDDLNEWFSRFVAIARVALQGQPEYLRLLGIG